MTQTDFITHPLGINPLKTANDIPPEVVAIIGYLSLFARSKKDAVTAPGIAQALGIGDLAGRHVRNLISLYQADFPFIVVAIPGKGYYITDDPDEMAHYHQTLYSLLKSNAARIKSFKTNCRRNGYEPRGTAPHIHYTHQEAY